MGLLIIPTNPNKGKEYIQNNKYIKRSNFSNPDAVKNLIRYITRTKENERMGIDLIAYGAVGVSYNFQPDNVIKQFLFVQNEYGIDRKGGRRMHHEVFILYDCEVAELNYQWEQLYLLGMECSQIYFQQGFQVVFAIHWEEGKHYHIHFAINSINFIDGHKFHTSKEEVRQRDAIFNHILFNQQIALKGASSPIIFCDKF